jgi:CubicO group peptidase (beta-lactamase class C family)
MRLPQVLMLALATACGGSTEPTSSLTGQSDTVTVADDGRRYWPGVTWRTTSPEKVGIDEAVLRAITGKVGVGSLSGIQSVFVVRRGYVVAERYYGVNGEDVHTLQSVTKSVTSLLVGIALDEGAITSIDRPVLESFTEKPLVANTDAAQRALTPRHLLGMRTGMDF